MAAGRAANYRYDQQAFFEELPGDFSAAGAECKAYAELSLAASVAGYK
jgi:hypothetical protein